MEVLEAPHPFSEPPAAEPPTHAAPSDGGGAEDAPDVKMEDEEAEEATPSPPPLRDKPTPEELAALVKQRQLFHAQSEAMLQLAKRHKEVTGVDPLSSALKDVNGRLPVEDAKRARLALSPHAEAVLTAQFAIRDVLSRDDFIAAAKLARCSEEAARSTFQSMRGRARRFVTKHAPPPAAVTPAPLAAATPFDDDDDDAPAPVLDAFAALAAAAAAETEPPPPEPPRQPTPAELDLPLYAELVALRLPDGSVGFPAAAVAAVGLMLRAKSVGLRAALADLIHASRMQLGVPIVFVDEGACTPLAAWIDAALATHHITLLRSTLRATAALPVASAEPVKELARQLHRCRAYTRADDVAAEATRILATWAKALTPGGASARPPAAAAAMSRAPLPPAAPPAFNGPAISKVAAAQLASRAAAPSTVAVRSAADRLAGANERVATGARPLSADEILRQRNKKRLIIGSSASAAPARGGSAAPLPPELAKRLKAVAGSAAPPVNVAAPPLPDPDAMQARVHFVHPPAVAIEGLAASCLSWGSESVETALQARRESETPAATYMLAALIPDDPAMPLHVSTEAQAALAAPLPLLPDVPVDHADAAHQAAALAAAGYYAVAAHIGAGWRGVARGGGRT